MSREEFFDLFVEELKDIYDAEQRIVKALPKMIEASANPDLAEAFQSHLKETKHQVSRLEQISSLIRRSIDGGKCEAMKGLIEEAEEMVHEYSKSAVRDAAIIAAAQRVEHYEIAVYGTLKTFASELDLDDKVEDLLDDTLKEEGNADKKLTKIAQGSFFTTGINETARKGGR